MLKTWMDTALIQAAHYGKLEVVKILLNKGADVNAKDASGDTALIQASHNNNPEVVEILKAHGAKE